MIEITETTDVNQKKSGISSFASSSDFRLDNWRPALPTVAGRGADDLAEDLGQVAGAGEAGGLGHPGNRQIGFQEEPAGPLQADALELFVNRPADRLAEPDLQASPRDQELPTRSSTPIGSPA